MKYYFHPEADAELIAAIDYYEEKQIGLGYDFAEEIYTGIKSIIDHPQTWPILSGEIRRRLIGRFPYAILYSDEGHTIYILAIMHLSRNPNYWRKRIISLIRLLLNIPP
jgi:plasmid stabilization system protein ParE